MNIPTENNDGKENDAVIIEAQVEKNEPVTDLNILPVSPLIPEAEVSLLSPKNSEGEKVVTELPENPESENENGNEHGN